MMYAICFTQEGLYHGCVYVRGNDLPSIEAAATARAAEIQARNPSWGDVKWEWQFGDRSESYIPDRVAEVTSAEVIEATSVLTGDQVAAMVAVAVCHKFPRGFCDPRAQEYAADAARKVARAFNTSAAVLRDARANLARRTPPAA
jgi:hypothetical protein